MKEDNNSRTRQEKKSTPTNVHPPTSRATLFSFSFQKVLIVLAGLLLSYLYSKYEWRAETIVEEGWSLKHVVRGQIERIEWRPDKSFADDLVKLGSPVILSNTMTSMWKATTLWQDPQYLSTHPDLLDMPKVETCPNSTFFFVDEKAHLAKANIPGINLTTNFHHINLTSKEFFKRIYDPNEKNYYYWYGKVGRTLARDVQPFSNLWLTLSDKDQFGLFLWLSGSGTRPPIHIDSDHNFYVHVHGRKRFILFPPSEWKNLYMYPRLHPQWHKSQVKFENPDLNTFPNYRNARGYEALLEPGDVMYIPPYWWHHVESISPCVSMASWSQGPIWKLMKPVYERKLTFEKLQEPKSRLAAVKLHIDILLKQVMGKKTKEYMNNVITARWHPLKTHFIDTPAYKDSDFCNTNSVTLDPSIVSSTENEAQYSSSQFLSLSPVELREIDLADFIETIASDALGAQNVYAFLTKCF